MSHLLVSSWIHSETHSSCLNLAFLVLVTNKADVSGEPMDVLRQLDTTFQDGAPLIYMKAA